ncbi:MAG: histidine--tRNA ligase [Polyangiales bacterium]
MHDILPADSPRWQLVESTFRNVARQYGYGEVRTPIVEPTALFARGVGETTDIVEKEMYTFVDKGEDSLTMRPEGTAPAVRAFVEHNVSGQDPVTKWIYTGPMFRRERPAKGRYRQFYQLGAECFGDPGPFVDAELIDFVVRFFHEVGVTNVEVRLSSLGSGETHARYREALLAYFTPHREKLSTDSQRRLETNPLRIVDSKSPEDQALAANAPRVLEFLSDDDRTHFEELQRSLDRLKVPYFVDGSIVRGLDYYTRTVFEVKDRSGRLGAQDTICGGGRYDGLVKTLGGPETPAVGFGLGIERLLLVLDDAQVASAPSVFVAVVAPELRTDAMAVLQTLRHAGIAADADLRGNSLKSQLRRSDKLGAKVALILGGDELARGVVQARNLETKETVELPLAGLVDGLRGFAPAFR